MTTQTMTETAIKSGAGARVPFDGISEPGAYVCETTGQLLRIPQEELASGRAPTISILGRAPMMVTKIDDDPFVPVGKARLCASNSDLVVNF